MLVERESYLGLTDGSQNAELGQLMSEIQERQGEIINLYRVLGNSPAMLRAWVEMAWPLRYKSTISRRIRELAILRVGYVTNAEYEWNHHKAMALANNITEQEIENVRSELDVIASSFSPIEAHSIFIADEITRTGTLSDQSRMLLKEFWLDSEIVELVLIVSFYNCVARVVEALKIPMESGWA